MSSVVLSDGKNTLEFVKSDRNAPLERRQSPWVEVLHEAIHLGDLDYLGHCPTETMLADCLTKPGHFQQVMTFLSIGLIQMRGERLTHRERRRLVAQSVNHTLSSLD